MSNALTGQLIGLALQELDAKLPSMDFELVNGWYWRLKKEDDGRENLTIETQTFRGATQNVESI